MSTAIPTEKSGWTLRDTKSGRLVTVQGVGALKGHLKIDKGVDLTKPIASQAMRANGRSKHRPTGKP